MKKRKKEKVFLVKSLLFIFISVFWVSISYAIDTIGDYIKTQTSTTFGSNNSKITFSKKLTTYYLNKNDDTNIIGDYLKGYYYDNRYGYFRLDWSSNKSQNVRFTGTTSKCSSGDGHKLGGFAYSKYVGYIKFDYDTNNYVYYCENDNKLHGLAYSKHLGFQNFEGIGFKIVDINSTTSNIEDNTEFVNNPNIIKEDSNGWTSENIGGGDRYEIENAKIIEGTGSLKSNESIFWIIK